VNALVDRDASHIGYRGGGRRGRERSGGYGTYRGPSDMPPDLGWIATLVPQ
jgi:hypothetical protein